MKVCDQLQRMHFPFNKTNVYARDKGGKNTYEFNSLGYRGEEFNPDAKFKIFLFGPSSALVTGLNIEDSFAYRFKQLVAKHNNWLDNEVNLMNFAVATTSTDYSIRNLIRQCDPEVPDLVIIDLSHKSRMEWIKPNGVGSPFGIGMPRTPISYFDLYEDEMGFVNSIKNIALAQFFCQKKGINYIFVNSVIDFAEFENNVACQELMTLIERSHICDIHQMERIDHADDTLWDSEGNLLWWGHAGVKTNMEIANRLFIHFLQLSGSDRSPDSKQAALVSGA